MTIYNIELGEEEAQNLSQEVKELIKSLEGKVVSENFWSKRKFAYKIGTQEEGFYDVVQFDIDAAKIDDLKKQLNLKEQVIRYLISALEE
jgi:ribosomal protein S6